MCNLQRNSWEDQIYSMIYCPTFKTFDQWVPWWEICGDAAQTVPLENTKCRVGIKTHGDVLCYSHSVSKWDVTICTASCVPVVIFLSVEVWSGAEKTSIELKLVKDKNIVFKTKELERKWAYGGWYVEYQVTPFGTWAAYVRLHAGQSLFLYRGCSALLQCCLMLESTSAFWYYCIWRNCHLEFALYCFCHIYGEVI